MKILLDTIEKVKEFQSRAIASGYSDIRLRSGEFVVDGKSLMGVFSLDLTRPVDVIISDNENADYEAFKLFEV